MAKKSKAKAKARAKAKAKAKPKTRKQAQPASLAPPPQRLQSSSPPVRVPVPVPDSGSSNVESSSEPYDANEVSGEHRSQPRVSLAVEIHLTSDSHFFSGLSGDISEGGLFVSTYRPLEPGSEVDLEFSLPGDPAPVHARGEVRWLREHSAHEPRGVGIAFETLGDEDRAKIHRFCTIRPPLYYDDVG